MATRSALTSYHLPVATIYAGDLDITAGNLDLNSQGSIVNVGAAGNDWIGASLTHKGSGFSKFERTTAGTSTSVVAVGVQMTSAGDMADGFGPHIAFIIEDGGSSNTQIGQLGFSRNGADNTGDFTLSTFVTGSLNDAFKVSPGGQVSVDLDSDLSTSSSGSQIFDDYDDAKALQQFAYMAAPENMVSPEQRQANIELMLEMGVVSRVDGAKSGYHINLQPILRLLAGGIYQNRQLIENKLEVLNAT